MSALAAGMSVHNMAVASNMHHGPYVLQRKLRTCGPRNLFQGGACAARQQPGRGHRRDLNHKASGSHSAKLQGSRFHNQAGFKNALSSLKIARPVWPNFRVLWPMLQVALDGLAGKWRDKLRQSLSQAVPVHAIEAEGPKDHINLRILQATISGISLGLTTKIVGSVCLRGHVGSL